MKRTPLARTSPLRTRSPLVASSPLARGTRLARTTTTTTRRRPARTAAETRARRIVAERSGGRCEMCGRNPAGEAHHRQNRSQGGAWAPSNLLHLCSACHLHVTTHPAIAREQGWSVPSHRTPAHVPVWLAGRGWALLDDTGAVVAAEEGPR